MTLGAISRRLLRSARAGLRATTDELKLLAPVYTRSAEESCDFPVQGRYLVSSERGVFEVSANRIRRACPLPAFGIARVGDDFYAATWTARDSVVMRGRIRDGADGVQIDGLREIFRAPMLSDAGRIHQIGVYGDALWLCNTAFNQLTKLDRRSGTFLANVAPFRCSYGHPISGDHNHINSVFPQGRWLLFSAFKINRRGAFGLIGGGECRIWAHRNIGIHDCVIAGRDFWFSDSYRFWDGVGKGCVYRGREQFDAAHFDATENGFVRGIAGHGSEELFGNSHSGSRETRFAGRGNLMLAREGRVTHRISFPGAQVYDVIRADGRHFEAPPSVSGFADAARLLDEVFGPPVESMPLREVLVGRSAKKFDESDIGAIEEYL